MYANQLTGHNNILNASSADSSHNIAVISYYKGLVIRSLYNVPIGAGGLIYTLKIKIVLYIYI